MKKVLKRMCSMILVIILVTMCGCGGTDKKNQSTSKDGEVSEKLQELRKKGKIVIGSGGDIPVCYIDQETGELKGVDAEIIKEVAKRLGIGKVEMKLIPFSELIINLNGGNIDMITDGMYIKKERAKQVCFGDVWYTQGGSLLVPNDSKIESIDDFNPNKTVVGYTEGTIWQEVVEGWLEKGKIANAVATGTQPESIVALQYGKIDAYLTDSIVIENLFLNDPSSVEGLRLAKNFKDTKNTVGHMAPAVSYDDEKFMQEVNEVVVQLRDEGFLEKVLKEYGLDPNLHMISNDERVYEPET